MNEEIDLLKYLLTNIKIQQDMLYKILKKKEIKDEVYELIRHNILEYKKFNVSIRRMLKSRMKKYNGETNIAFGIASSIGANIKADSRLEYLELMKEYNEVNLLDIERVKKEYKIKSKTVMNLIDRMEQFEKNSLDRIDLFINMK
ncbi:MAG: hypothetical protein J6A15_06335 [Clostridia bacterium]|nr:hypothetical protein [Clostridia bacterium]